MSSDPDDLSDNGDPPDQMIGKYRQDKSSHTDEGYLYGDFCMQLGDIVGQCDQDRLMQDVDRIGCAVERAEQAACPVQIFFSQNKQCQDADPSDEIDPQIAIIMKTVVEDHQRTRTQAPGDDQPSPVFFHGLHHGVIADDVVSE